MEFINAALLGVIEGLTEFLPISSTGHLILFGTLLGFEGPPGHVFEVVIQLGAMLAIVVLYWHKLLDVVLHLASAPSQRFVRNILIAFFPAMVIGFFIHDVIKSLLFNPTCVALAMIIGGALILVMERVKPAPSITRTEDMPVRTALKIGLFQCIAMIPGVSRSGATIMGALLCGLERKTAAEFSFFLALPTMFAATSYDLFKARHDLTMDGLQLIAIGFFVSFLVALLVVRWLVRFVQTHGFAVFAYYRMVVGALILALIYA